jgi:hypothetical protein
MLRPPAQCLKNEHVKRALQEIEALLVRVALRHKDAASLRHLDVARLHVIGSLLWGPVAGLFRKRSRGRSVLTNRLSGERRWLTCGT